MLNAAELPQRHDLPKAQPFVILPPRPGVLELTAPNQALLKSFSQELKVRPEAGAWVDSASVILGRMEKIQALIKEASGNERLQGELIQAGYLPHPGQLKLMGLKENQVVELPKPLEVEMRRKGFFYLQALTHPAILKARSILQEQGYQRATGKMIPVFEEGLTQHKAFTYEDFGLQPVAAMPDDRVQESSSKILAQGLFSWISKNHLGFPTMSNSMPSTNSAEALASLALIGTFAFLPTDGPLTSLDSRLNLLEWTKKAIREHPVVQNHKHKDVEIRPGVTVKDELESRVSFVGATLKQDPRTIVEEAKAFYDRGVRVFRVYDAGSTNQLYQAIDLLKNEPSLAGITVLAGQVTSVAQARLLVGLGADGLIVGIGEGGICTTPVVGSLAPNNILVAYELCKADLGVPVICDGGVGRAAGVIFAMGATGAMASRRIIGGTIEHSPVCRWMKRNGHLEKPYAGEASGVIKILGGNVTMVGDPYNLEGISSFVQLNTEYPTVAALYAGLLAGFAKTVRFNRAHSLIDLQGRSLVSNIKYLSDGARAAAGAHHVEEGVNLVLYGDEVFSPFEAALAS